MSKTITKTTTKTKKSKNANGEGSLFFDEKNNRWRIQVSYKSPNGETKRKSFSGKTKTEVREKKSKFLFDIANNKITNTAYVTMVDLLKESAEYDRQMNLIKDNTYIRKLETIKIIETNQIGKIPIINIDENQLIEFLSSIKSNYSNSCISKVYESLARAYRLAIHKKILSYNLMDSPFIKKPKSNKPTKKIYAFTVEEQKQFLKVMYNKTYKKGTINYTPMFEIELFAGLRMGEICALQPKDINLKKRLIRVSRTTSKDLDDCVTLSNTPKTKQGVRDVPIQPCLIPTLVKVLNSYKPNKDGLLFYNFKMNRPISTQQANCSFKRLCIDAGIKTEGGQHLLRHTFATRCIESNVSANVLKNWMGHSDISITLNIYCDVFDRLNANSIDKVSNYYNEVFN